MRQAARTFASQSTPASEKLNMRESFMTNGPRQPGYVATPLRSIFNALKELKLPKNNQFADLGSGLGMVCFAASFFFKHVTGFEIDPRLRTKAKQIQRKFGLQNVQFLNKDFLKADLRPYKTIFLFQPFVEGFSRLMVEKLKETRSGTFIISYVVDLRYISTDIVFHSNYTDRLRDSLCGNPPDTFVFKRR